MTAVRASKEFEQSVISMMPKLKAFAIKLTKDQTKAEDLVQDCVLKALSKHEQFQSGTNLAAWLYTILRNEFFSKFRKGQREVEDPDDVIAINTADDRVNDHSTSDELTAVTDMLDALDPQTREILLDIANGFSYHETALKHKLAEGTIKSRVSRARQVLLGARNQTVTEEEKEISLDLREISVPNFARIVEPPVDIGPPPIVRWLPITDLRVNPKYQREILDRGKRNIVSIVGKFDWRKFGTVVVADVGGGLFSIIDGQHRTTAALACGLTHVPCQVIEASLEAQAEAFAAINGNVTALTPMQIHQAKIAAGDPETVRLEAVCKAAGVKILAYPVPADKIGPSQTMAVKCLRGVLARYGEAVLTASLMCLSKTRGGNPGLFRQQIIQALCALLSKRPSLVTAPEKAIAIASNIRFDRVWHDAQIESKRVLSGLTPTLIQFLQPEFGGEE